MKKIISVSRRTDIPAFYGQWFMNRLKEGFTGVVNPFGGKKYIVSLKPEDVSCFVFWSKNFTPFLENLKILDESGYKFYFNYTITSLPEIFESNLDKQSAIDSLKYLAKTYSPAHINWRFDPVIISSVCDAKYFIERFRKLAAEFDGLVERCYISFVTEYKKVLANFDELEKNTQVKIEYPDVDFKIALANELSDIASGYGIKLYSCCCDYLINEKVQKAHCIDGAVIEKLFFPEGFTYKEKHTRQECGCTESYDIGTYNTCPHGCIYCYANTNKGRANSAFRIHDANSAFLGYTKSQSDQWLEEIQNTSPENKADQRLFE
ncbi:MAG: DUF1848 domain-containing protein [Sedimentisphaerales bacterium]|nr:DUF1848 domain-containing protein [Sedimentisphaerales bacterium]